MSSQLALPISDRKTTALRHVRSLPDRYWPDFYAYLLENWPVYEAFEAKALRLWNSGRTHYGQRSLWEVLRFETATHEVRSDFKLNDHYTKSIARLFEWMNPRCSGMFAFRERPEEITT